MPNFYGKRIADPVHGTVEVSPLELEVISGPAFQRLHNVKQLGLAHLVYPGADYSRFSHSLGVCHVTGRILTSLRERAGVQIDDTEIQQYRLAALLHDIGHYPFSHAMERAINDYFVGRNLLQPVQSTLPSVSGGDNSVDMSFFKHEDLAKEILEKDKVLRGTLDKAGVGPDDIYSKILRLPKAKPGRFANLISSDIDADRIDYLLRSARHTGLPYGSVDLDYLVTQLRADESTRICFTHRALRTAEHLLLARYFDYQQINYHKTVSGLELLLEDVLKTLLRAEALRASADDMSKAISTGAWESFDDPHILSCMRDFQSETHDKVAQRKIWSLLHRSAPKLLADYERLDERRENRKREFKTHRSHVQERIEVWAHQFQIDASCWYVWDVPGMSLTKVGSRIPYSDTSDDDADKLEQTVRILDRDGRTSTPIVEVENSLMHVLADKALYALRVYVLLTPDQEKLREKIRQTIRSEIDLPWK